MSSTEVGFIKGMELGQGFNTATYDINPPGLDHVEVSKGDTGTGGQDVSYQVDVKSSTQEVKKVLNVSASASFKYEMSFSGSAAAKFANSIEQKSYSLYIIVRVKVINKQIMMNLGEIKLKDHAKTLYKDDPNAFINRYGDSFVYGRINGGEFMGVLEIETQSESDFKEVQASLSATINTGELNAKGKAEFQESLKNLNSSYHMKAYVNRQGGNGELNKVTPEQLQKDSLAFPGTINDKDASPLSVLVMSYSNIPIEGVDEDKISSIVSSQVSKIDELGALQQKFVSYHTKLNNSLNKQELYPGIKVNEIQERIYKISEQISSINETAKLCFSDRTQCNLPETIDKTLLEDILPTQIPNLGQLWVSSEGGWRGEWVRRDNTNKFDATWTKNGNKNKAVLTIKRNQNKILIERVEKGVKIMYTGIISGNTVKGTQFYAGRETQWSAEIYGLV
ncbi:hypothetical protein [Guptibacillus hwajinpoensis]|uniref:hypothetical protein n=1 Tax=Guptibacillus hwajinpoensis TaxID=208199 RepID=UPI00069D40B1|nr:hypothetical protein [Alkalihalobacillus macyae]